MTLICIPAKMKRLSKLLCRGRDKYAEIYSQAYSQSFAEDDYLAKQKHVPSSTSLLSNDLSLHSADSDDVFVELVTSVDLLQIGSVQKAKNTATATKKTGTTTLVKTVASIEGKDTEDFDIEDLLERVDTEPAIQDSGHFNVEVLLERFEEEPGMPATRKAEEEGFNKMDPMHYHVLSRRSAKSKRHLRHIPVDRVSPLVRVKQRFLKPQQQFDVINEEMGEVPAADESVSSDGILFSTLELDLAPKPLIRSVSSDSAMYIDESS